MAPPSNAMAPPLTHHQIVEIVAPFVRAGHALDLPASDRPRRRLVFRSVVRDRVQLRSDNQAAEATLHSLLEALQLDSPRPGLFCLTRTVCEAGGLTATLQVAGAEPADLLARVKQIPVERHFYVGPAFQIASSGCLDVRDGHDARMRLTFIESRTGDVTLKAHVSPSAQAAATSARIELQVRRTAHALPADLLAVLGWDWSMLHADSPGWRGSVRLRGSLASPGNDAENKLRLAMAHLARTFAEPPSRFHERLRGARCRALARHAIPSLVCAMLGLEGMFADALRAARGSPLTLGLICLPVAVLMFFLWRSEQPRLSLPTWPRPLATHAWEASG